MANSQEKRPKVSQTNCQGIKISRTVSIKHTCKHTNTIDDSQLNAAKNKKGKWSKLRSDISNVFKTNNMKKHSTAKSQSVKQVLKIEENNERKKPEEAASKNGVKMRRMRSVKMKQREGESETKEGNQELCKKRILMGGKCRSVEETHDVIFVGKWTMFQMGGHEGENQLFSKLPSPYFDDGEDQGNEHF
ncbi:hypothetical protein ACET3Z_030898 [Daucus carota]